MEVGVVEQEVGVMEFIVTFRSVHLLTSHILTTYYAPRTTRLSSLCHLAAFYSLLTTCLLRSFLLAHMNQVKANNSRPTSSSIGQKPLIGKPGCHVVGHVHASDWDVCTLGHVPRCGAAW